MKPKLEEKVTFVTHKGKRLLFIDANGIQDVAFLRTFIDHTIKIILQEPEKSIYFLGDIRNANFNSTLINSLKQAIVTAKPYLVASAYVSSGGLQEIILKGLAKVTKRNMKAFKGMDEAKDWLADQD